jgi:hypothetical protein
MTRAIGLSPQQSPPRTQQALFVEARALSRTGSECRASTLDRGIEVLTPGSELHIYLLALKLKALSPTITARPRMR